MKITLNKEFVITSDYGSIDSAHSTSHTGIDLQMAIGTDIVSPVKGIVSRVVDYGAENVGKGIVVKFENGKELIFGHLSKITVKKGELVSIGQKLGESGNTGNSTGPHLHLGLKVDGTFADPSLYERMFQKVYNLTHGGGMPFKVIPHDISFSDYLNQIYLSPDHQAIINGVQQAIQTLFN